MRLLVFVSATLLAATSAFAQMQRPTTPPRLVKKRELARQARPAQKRVAPAKQSSAPSKAPVATPAPAPAPVTEPVVGKSVWEEHLQIRWFSEVIGPNLANTDGAWAYPDVNKNGNYTPGSDPVSSWNQISFRWKISENYYAIINPRFSTHLASTKRIRKANEGKGKDEDEEWFRWENWLVGVQGTAWKSDTSGWSVFVRPGYRLPTNKAFRNAGWRGEFELFYSVDWAGASPWGYGLWHQIRHYVPSYKDPLRLDFSDGDGANGLVRHRHYIAPYLTYKFTDTVKLEIYYEHQYNHQYSKGGRTKANGYRHGYFSYPKMSRAQHTANVGVSFPINPSLSLYPFVRAYQLGTFDPETLGYGLWIMGAIY